MTDVLTSHALTNDEFLAGLDADQLRQLVGLVDYDQAADPFPVIGWDAIVWAVGNATQTAHFFISAFGMELVGYTGPEAGTRDHKAYVLRSGACRFVIKGGVTPDSPLLDHHRAHGDGVVTSWAPRIAPPALGFAVTAFITLEILQHEGRTDISDRLARIPEVLECWTVTGSGDLWCRIVAHSNTDLQRVIDAMVTDPSVVRSVTLIGLTELIGLRTEPLVRQSAG